jgi:hypothetical protein
VGAGATNPDAAGSTGTGDPAATKYCMHCGKSIPKMSKFCPECGQKQE